MQMTKVVSMKKILMIAGLLSVVISAILSILIFMLVVKCYEQNYGIFDIRDMGLIKINDNEYVYVSGNLDSMQKTYGSVIVIGKIKTDAAQINISTILQSATLKTDGYRFSSSSIVLIPIYDFTNKKTVITTGRSIGRFTKCLTKTERFNLKKYEAIAM